MKKLSIILFIVALSATAVKGIGDGLGTDSLATNYVTQNSSNQNTVEYSNYFLTKTKDGTTSVPWIRITILCLFLVLASYAVYRICLDDYYDSWNEWSSLEIIFAVLIRVLLFNLIAGLVFWMCFGIRHPDIPIFYDRIILWVIRYVFILLTYFIFYLINCTDFFYNLKQKIRRTNYSQDQKPNSIVDSTAGSEGLE